MDLASLAFPAVWEIAGAPLALVGGAIVLAVVYRPQWVASFDDARYIVNR